MDYSGYFTSLRKQQKFDKRLYFVPKLVGRRFHCNVRDDLSYQVFAVWATFYSIQSDVPHISAFWLMSWAILSHV